jgi:hypothetical protein
MSVFSRCFSSRSRSGLLSGDDVPNTLRLAGPIETVAAPDKGTGHTV